jgi:hypothetical protein
MSRRYDWSDEELEPDRLGLADRLWKALGYKSEAEAAAAAEEKARQDEYRAALNRDQAVAADERAAIDRRTAAQAEEDAADMNELQDEDSEDADDDDDASSDEDVSDDEDKPAERKRYVDKEIGAPSREDRNDPLYRKGAFNAGTKTAAPAAAAAPGYKRYVDEEIGAPANEPRKDTLYQKGRFEEHPHRQRLVTSTT